MLIDPIGGPGAECVCAWRLPRRAQGRAARRASQILWRLPRTIARAALLLVFVAVSLAARSARAQSVSFGPHDVPTVFFVNKSKGLDRVDYALRLDSACRPASAAALVPYWREFEGGKSVRTHGLTWLQRVGYGVQSQGVQSRSQSGVEYAFQLKQFARKVVISIRQGPGGSCRATPHTQIAGFDGAELLSVYLELDGPLSVKYIDVHGLKAQTREPVVERIVQQRRRAR